MRRSGAALAVLRLDARYLRKVKERWRRRRTPHRQGRLCCGEIVAGMQPYQDRLPSGINVTYLGDEQVPYVGRRPRAGGADPHGRCP